MEKQIIYQFKFFILNNNVKPLKGSRISIWREDEPSLLLPCEFKEVFNEGDFYRITLTMLFSESFNSSNNIGRKFYFGPKDHTVGYGILEDISFAD
jgi:hypothetical protein